MRIQKNQKITTNLRTDRLFLYGCPLLARSGQVTVAEGH
nr:MAG TPA: hypothetical protein [Caudoviricetes sp.]